MQQKRFVGIGLALIIVLLAIAAIVWRKTILYEPAKPPWLPPLPSQATTPHPDHR